MAPRIVPGGYDTCEHAFEFERTFVWMHRCRRLTRQHVQTRLAHEAMVITSQIASYSAVSTE
jgi:hypothetical protein